MTEPSVSALRFGIGLLLGAALGLGFDFLRPMRPRFLGDLLFCGLMGAVWCISASACASATCVWATLQP